MHKQKFPSVCILETAGVISWQTFHLDHVAFQTILYFTVLKYQIKKHDDIYIGHNLERERIFNIFKTIFKICIFYFNIF